jgi:hypothetical protein
VVRTLHRCCFATNPRLVAAVSRVAPEGGRLSRLHPFILPQRGPPTVTAPGWPSRKREASASSPSGTSASSAASSAPSRAQKRRAASPLDRTLPHASAGTSPAACSLTSKSIHPKHTKERSVQPLMLLLPLYAVARRCRGLRASSEAWRERGRTTNRRR